MSIFESKEFWSTTVIKNKEKEFDRNSISIGIIEQSKKANINVGSFSGNLHIYISSFGDNNSNTLKFLKNLMSQYYKLKLVIIVEQIIT